MGDLFTDEAIYVEGGFGVFRGREPVRDWVTTLTDLETVDEWHLIDNDLCFVTMSR